MKSFKDIVEVKSKTAVFAFGRFNPPTAGHLKLAMKVKQVMQVLTMDLSIQVIVKTQRKIH